ncbi:MAG: MarR family transcriptional regulator [Acidocella sp. 20-57-95]|nr:MAG: MarR family transcriptional regulator [Acidocella sp. 20-57-95]OYV60500.1 MAG: MarR family transcriptional regulator [Acidocella sp. 21-58-7]HQT62888.1 MarR family transcriptional regulator [Acidocella sp.]HQU04756.1 MarR family transcriptional regulator [Acidocella sp.]
MTIELDIAGALAERPGFLIRRMHQIHLALFAEECAAFDITPVQYSIMTVADSQPGLDQAQLAYEVGVDRATLANVVARLETKGLLRRRPSVSDKRVKLVSLSSRGAALLEKMLLPVQRAHDRTIAALPPKDRETFMALLMRLVNAENDYGRAPLKLG